MTVFLWRKGKTLLWDATCVDTLAASNLKLSNSLAAATAAEGRKRKKYSDLSKNHLFLPFGIETLGFLGSAAKQFINELKARMSVRDRLDDQYFLQNLALAFQTGNATFVLVKAARKG